MKLESAQEFVQNSIVSADKIRELMDEKIQAIELEGFVVERLGVKRETFRDESIVDFYTSIISDLIKWKNLQIRQILSILTVIQGLMCQIERKNSIVEAFIHSGKILMGEGKGFLFNSQLYPKVVDYIIEIVFQHRNLYEILLEESPQEVKTIEESRTVRKSRLSHL